MGFIKTHTLIKPNNLGQTHTLDLKSCFRACWNHITQKLSCLGCVSYSMMWEMKQGNVSAFQFCVKPGACLWNITQSYEVKQIFFYRLQQLLASKVLNCWWKTNSGKVCRNATEVYVGGCCRINHVWLGIKLSRNCQMLVCDDCIIRARLQGCSRGKYCKKRKCYRLLKPDPNFFYFRCWFVPQVGYVSYKEWIFPRIQFAFSWLR